MAQNKFEKDRNRFSLSERLIVELFLLSYLFVFFLGEGISAIPFIWFLISIIGGVIAYFLFTNRDYSLGYGIALALILTGSLVPLGVPLLNVSLFFLYVLWRIQGNFNGSRIKGWPFVAVNTLAFVSITFVTRLLFPFQEPELLVQRHLSYYLLSSFLYYFVRMITIGINSKHLRNFKVKDAYKVLSFIIGTGMIVFVAVLTILKPLRLGILFTFVFVFSGLFTLFGKAVEPLLEFFRSGAEKFMEEEMVELDGEREIEPIKLPPTYEEGLLRFETAAIIIAILILSTIAVVLFRKKRQARHIEKQEEFTFSLKGRKNRKSELGSLAYDYSKARDEVRKKFEQFEIEAQSHDLTRMQGETVSEWFSRMDWGQEEVVITTYNDVRYGSQIPSESEQQTFILRLEKIKEKFFIKKV